MCHLFSYGDTICAYTVGQTGVRNLSWYLRMKPLRLPSKFVDIKLLVENHLNSAFYTYSVMSNYDNRVRSYAPYFSCIDKNCMKLKYIFKYFLMTGVEYILDVCRDASTRRAEIWC